jgi:thioredoxin-related protein
MKILLLSTLFISVLFGAELNWINNYDKALEQAKKEHKDLYIFIGADECRFCTLFKKEALSKKSIIKRLNEEYIPVYLSRDQHQIPSKFAIRGVPRHYFVDSNGTIYHEDRGSREENGFHSILDEAELQKE